MPSFDTAPVHGQRAPALPGRNSRDIYHVIKTMAGGEVEEKNAW